MNPALSSQAFQLADSVHDLSLETAEFFDSIMTDSLRDYLYDQIPLTKAMEVEVGLVSESSLSLKAPIGPNINHRETVFEGSATVL